MLPLAQLDPDCRLAMKGEKFNLKVMLEEIQREVPAEDKEEHNQMSQTEINKLINERLQKPQPSGRKSQDPTS